MSYECLSQIVVKRAHRKHKCEWCGEEIPKGSSYQKTAGKFEGDFQSSCQHSECFRAMNSLSYRELEDGYMPYEYARGRTDDLRNLPPEF